MHHVFAMALKHLTTEATAATVSVYVQCFAFDTGSSRHHGCPVNSNINGNGINGNE